MKDKMIFVYGLLNISTTIFGQNKNLSLALHHNECY